MAAVDNASVVGTELEKVRSKIDTVFEYDDKFFSSIDKKNVEVISNRQMRVPIELRPGGNFTAFNPDGGDLGRGSGITWDKATLQAIFMAEGIEYTKLAEWGTNSDRKAVQNAVRKLLSRATDEIRRQIDGNSMGNGSGVVGTISGVSTSGGVDTYTLNSDGFGARLVRFAQVVQVFDTTLATNRGSGTITMWDVENKQISVTPAIAGSTTGDVLVVAGVSAPAASPWLFGVAYQHSNASTGTWLGFSRASTPEIRSNRVNAASSPLTLPFPRLAINKIGNRVGIDNNFNPTAWMHPCQKQAYEEIGQLVSVIYKQPKEEGLDMYFDRMQMAGAPVKDHFNWNQTRIDFVDGNVWGRGEILPIGFYKTDGRNIFEIRGASGGVATADIFYMVCGFQYFVSNPAATAYIDNLAVPSGY